MKVRYLTRCGRCREWMNPGTEASNAYGALWHLSCVLVYKQSRMIDAKARTIRA